MFKAIHASPRHAMANTVISDPNLAEAAIEQLGMAGAINFDLGDVRKMHTTITELHCLHDAISEHGLSQGLLAFANSGNQLSMSIPEIPTLTTGVAFTDTSDASRDAALEGIGRTIKEVAEAARAKIKATMDKIISGFKLRAQSLQELHTQLIAHMATSKDKTFDTEELGTTEKKLYPAKALMEMLDIACGTNALLFDLLKPEWPESVDAERAWQDQMDKTCMAHLGKYSVVHDGHILLPKGMAASFQEQGYTEQSFHEIGAKLQVYITGAISDGPRLAAEFTKKSEAAWHRIDELSGTSTATNGMTMRMRSRAGEILSNAESEVAEMFQSYEFEAWVHGVRNGLRIMGYLAKMFK